MHSNIKIKHNAFLPVAIVSGVLLLYILLLSAGFLIPVAGLVFLLSPLLIFWMSYHIIRYGYYNGKEFEDDEEWGYSDKLKTDLKIF